MTEELRKAILEGFAYEYKTEITGFETDCFGRTKLSVLMRFNEEVGERHITAFGASSPLLAEKFGTAFVFTKAALKIHRLPKSGEKLSVMTWCSGCKGIRFTRNFRTETEEGELLSESVCEAVLINLAERKIMRPGDVSILDSFRYYTGTQNGCEYPRKVAEPNGETVFTRTVRFSDIDRNGHLNNTVYADIAMDCLPIEILKKEPRELTLDFKNEALPGDEIVLKRNVTETSATISGAVGNKSCFTAEILF